MFTLKLEEIPDEGLNTEWVEGIASLSEYLESLSKIDFRFEDPLQSEVKISKAGQSILIRGKVQTRLILQCVRCLREFFYPISSEYELTLLPLKNTSFAEEVELSSEDMDSSFIEGGEIHLSEIACEQVFLEIPIKPLCQEDCRGLCPSCGIDLNLSSCNCKEKELGSKFLELQKLKLH